MNIFMFFVFQPMHIFDLFTNYSVLNLFIVSAGMFSTFIMREYIYSVASLRSATAIRT